MGIGIRLRLCRLVRDVRNRCLGWIWGGFWGVLGGIWGVFGGL